MKFFEKHRKLSRFYAFLFGIYWHKKCELCGKPFGVHERAKNTYWHKIDKNTLNQGGSPVCWKCDDEAKRLSDINNKDAEKVLNEEMSNVSNA